MDRKVFICGDTHGDYDIHKLITFNKAQPELTKEDYVIVAGDFGLIFAPFADTQEENTLREVYRKFKFTTLFIDGNHENFTRLFSLGIAEKFDGIVGVVSDDIFYLKRGNVYNINGKSIFTFGGGYSIDIARRTEGISYWKEELPNYQDYKNGLDSLEEAAYSVDYVITHTCPTSIFEQLHTYKASISQPEENLREYLEQIKNTAIFKHWYFGHFHDDIDIGDKFSMLYAKAPIELI